MAEFPLRSPTLASPATTDKTISSRKSLPKVPVQLKSFSVGLQERQLDAIAFFLRTKECILEIKEPSLSEEQCEDSGDGDDEDNLQLLSCMMQLVYYTVEDNSGQAQLWHFTEQMLHLVQAYLQKLTKSVVSSLRQVQLSGKSTDKLQRDVDCKLTVLTDYLEEIKSHISILERRRLKSQGHSHQVQSPEERRMGCVLSDMQRHLVNLWDSLDQKALTVEGILNGELTLLQTYLRHRFGRSAADLTCILEIGLDEGLAFIYDRDLASATNMFINMGFDPSQKLHQICMYTVDRVLRDYLINELSKTNLLTADEQEMIQYLHKLESLYSCPSFTIARQLKEEEIQSQSPSQSAIDKLLSALNQDSSFDLLSECGEIGPCDIINSETSSYCQVVLEWIRHWPTSVRQKILLEHSLSRKDLSHIQQLVSPAVIWEYLCCHLDVDRLQLWIKAQYPLKEDLSPYSEPVTWPYDQPITRDMLSNLRHCPNFIKEKILDNLARRGVFVPWEQNDLHLVLYRLVKNGLLFQKPSILDRCSTKHGVSPSDLHYHVIKLCLESRLPQLLYFYLDYWGLCEGATDLTEVGFSVTSLPLWVSLLLQCRLVADNLHDPMQICHMSMLPTLSYPNVRYSSIKDMINSNLIVRAVATLAYCPEQYKQVIEEADEASIQLFSAYPQLQQALFGDRLSTGRQTTPLTVYQLLENNAALDVSRLFGWQKTHTKVSDDCYQYLPHFSCEPLMAKYGHVETIDTEYYLRHGRPSFAFCNVLNQLLHSEARSLPLSRITEECHQAITMAISNFSDQTVPPACVAFIEMLGMDSVSLQLHLEVANYLSSCVTSSLSNRNDQTARQLQHFIASSVEECLRGNIDYQQQVLKWLIAATYWKIKSLHFNRVSVDAGFVWQLVLLWCVFYNLPLDTHFIEDCAKEDNWLLFLTFAQIYNYPTAQLIPILDLFPSHNLCQHLICVMNMVQEQEMKAARQGNTKTCSVLDKQSKIKPFTKSKSVKEDTCDASGESGTGIDTEVCEEERTVEQISSENAEPYVSEPNDLLAVLHKLLQSDDAVDKLCDEAVHYRSPVFSALAANHKESNIIRCMISWLLASSPPSCAPFSTDNCTKLWSKWSADTEEQLLSEVIHLLIKESLEYLVHKALAIFKPECELLPFLQFIDCIKANETKDKCLQYVQHFKQIYHKSRSMATTNHSLTNSDAFSLLWIENIIAALIEQFLTSCHCLSQIKTFLKCLHECSILHFFHCEVIDVSMLLKLHQVTSNTDVSMDYVLLGNKNHLDHKESCDHFLATLLEKKHFQEARLSAEILGTSQNDIIIKQLKSELEELQASDMWSSASNRRQYWSRCQEMMERHHVAASVVAQFFLDLVVLCKSNAECADVLKLAHDWLCRDPESQNTDETKRIFIKMWKCRIHDYLEKKESAVEPEDKSSHKLNKEELLSVDPKMLNFDLTQKEVLSTEEEGALHVKIGELLNRGCLTEAVRVIQMFGYEDKDFNIVTTCLRLAKGFLGPEEIGSDMRMIVAGPRPPSVRRISTTTATFPSTLSMVNIGSLINLVELDSDNSDDAVSATIQILSQHAVHAKHCTAFILTTYNISRVLLERFDNVLMLEDFALIHRLLASNSSNRYVLAKAYIIAAGIDDSQMASFLCDAIVEALQLWLGVVKQVSTSFGTDKPILLQPNIDQSGLRRNVGHGVQELLQLCVQPAVLGSRLLDTVTAMIPSSMLSTKNVFMIEVELLVYAHDCFTLSCHMEGISAVLRTARNLVLSLQQADEFILMISLLIGLARYNEMAYVFDILKQEHQFELLFRKGIDRDIRLRLAILDYLKRFHPNDMDTYSMASLNFTMYREIAGMLEDEARKELAKLKDKRMENTGEIQLILKKAISYFSDAAESYVKEKCLRHAEKCINEARLVALQTQLASTNIQVIHLDREAVHSFVCEHPKFYESYIVCEAYDWKCFWSDAIYYQVIKAGSIHYLNDLRCHIQLTPSLIHEVTEKFCQESQPTKQMYGQMKKLLLHCRDICLLHKMAARVGLPDITKEAFKPHPLSEAYLKDMGLIPQ